MPRPHGSVQTGPSWAATVPVPMSNQRTLSLAPGSLSDASLSEALVLPCRKAWELAVLFELARPATLQLLPVLDGCEKVVDFICTAATKGTQDLIGAPLGDLVCMRLSRILEDQPSRDQLLETYLAVANDGRRRLVLGSRPLSNEVHEVRHEISRLSRHSVVVCLKDTIAMERFRMAAPAADGAYAPGR